MVDRFSSIPSLVFTNSARGMSLPMWLEWSRIAALSDLTAAPGAGAENIYGSFSPSM